MTEHDVMECDVLIIGGGPAGLSAACRLAQQAAENETELNIVLLEKGSEIGAHILSGAVIETRALDELFPDWKERGAPLTTPVKNDQMFYLSSPKSAIEIPSFLVPPSLHNDGNYAISLGNLCRWLAEQAEALGVEIISGFPGAELIYDDDQSVQGVLTGNMGIGADGQEKNSFEPGMALHAKYTLLTEGCRGHLGKDVIEKFALDAESDPQHFALGIKELWTVEPDQHHAGLVLHGAGWPLNESRSSGGFFLYHMEDNQVVVGLITDLNYENPYVSPYDEFQRLKHHPVISKHLTNAQRVAYGARAIAKGGLNSLPKMSFPGGLLLGCDAGTLNVGKIKGTHTAMKSGLIAAECVFTALNKKENLKDLTEFNLLFRDSWAGQELQETRNFGPALHRWGSIFGGVFNFLDQRIFKGKLPFTLHDKHTDHARLKAAEESKKLPYLKPDGLLSFDRLSSVYLSNTNHEEDQPCHLKLADHAIPINVNLKEYDAPEQRYCPAGVYEIISENDADPVLQINAQNCVHCKTCDIKDPQQNITWVTPEGTGGPNYPNM